MIAVSETSGLKANSASIDVDVLTEFYMQRLSRMRFASHNQLHMFGFSTIVNLLCSAPGTALQVRVL